MNLGDSVICIGDLEMVKVHVHTNTPGVALTYALELGELDRPKIENMLEQNRQLRAKREAEKKKMGMLAICAGQGLADIFKDLFVDRIIEGGQTMNPSASDIATAAQKINAEHIFVFPNNKNIILAAEQAKALAENRTIHVIPTKNVPQGFAAALEFNPEASAEENKTNMIHAMDNVKAGQVTYAVRNTSMNGFSIKQGDIIVWTTKKFSQNFLDGGDGQEALGAHERGFPSGHHAVLRRGREGGRGGGALRENRGEISRLRRGLPQRRTAVYYYILSLE